MAVPRARSDKTVRGASKLPRGVVVVRSGSTGLVSGKSTQLSINGKVQQFDWDKAALLTRNKGQSGRAVAGY